MPRSATKALSETGGELWTRSLVPQLELPENQHRPLPMYAEFPFRPSGWTQNAYEYLGHYAVKSLAVLPATDPAVLQFLKTRGESGRKRDADGWKSQLT
jgi:hypothetical protein